MFRSRQGRRRIPTHRTERAARAASMYTKLGSQLAAAAGRLALGTGRDEVADAFHRQAAATIRDSLSKMKGLPMKAGQLLSVVDHPLIPLEHRHHYRDAFQPLQTGGDVVRWTKMRDVFVADIGQRPIEVFDTIDITPIAAASIGQVYRAEKDGRTLAVKIQYPGIEDAIRADLQNIGLLRNALKLLLRDVEVERALADLSERVLEECDYRTERQNQDDFAAAWAGDPDIVVPATVPELCGQRVLVTEFIEARSWQQMLEQADDAARERSAKAIFRFTFNSLYGHGLINADPHPGNFLFYDDGRVAFLDFGWVQRFADEHVARLAKARALCNELESDAFREAAIDAWGLPDTLDDEEWAFLLDYFACIFAPAREVPFRYDEAYAEQLSELSLRGSFLLARKALRKGVAAPKQEGMTALGRMSYGLTGLLSRLDVEADWRSLLD